MMATATVAWQVGMLKPVETVREFSYLDNPRTPPEYRHAGANVTLGFNSSDELAWCCPPAAGGTAGRRGGAALNLPPRTISYIYKTLNPSCAIIY